MDAGIRNIFEYKGRLSHNDLLDRLWNSKYGVHLYCQGDINNDLCAPLKIFEYLAEGCIVLSVIGSKGLVSISKQYPGLVVFLDNLTCETVWYCKCKCGGAKRYVFGRGILCQREIRS